MIEVHHVGNDLGCGILDFAADEDIDALESAVFTELLDQVFSDCAGSADYKGFQFL